MDFGMAVQSHSASGTPLQYFRAVGKDFYRAPECYVPQSTEVAVVAPSTATSNEVAMVRTGSGYLCQVRFPADVAPRKTCKAEVWGYTVNPVDIFASGAILFMLCTKCPPWHCARMSDPSFSYVYDRGDKGLGALLEALLEATQIFRGDEPAHRHVATRSCFAPLCVRLPLKA